MRYTITNKLFNATFDTKGAELVSLVRSDGFEYIWNGEEWKDHAPVLFPICGRLHEGKYSYDGKEYEMLIHGIAKYTEFKVVDLSTSSIVFELTESEETLKRYPFAFKLTCAYRLEDNKLLADFTVENTDNRELPYMFGWHPGFTLGGKGALSDFEIAFDEGANLMQYPPSNVCFVSRECYPFPHGSRFNLERPIIHQFDTVLLSGDVHHAVLSSVSDSHTVEIRTSENLPYFAIWKMPVDEARYICLEPWSGIPGVGGAPERFETKGTMTRIAPGKSKVYSYEVTLG